MAVAGQFAATVAVHGQRSSRLLLHRVVSANSDDVPQYAERLDRELGDAGHLRGVAEEQAVSRRRRPPVRCPTQKRIGIRTWTGSTRPENERRRVIGCRGNDNFFRLNER